MLLLAKWNLLSTAKDFGNGRYEIRTEKFAEY